MSSISSNGTAEHGIVEGSLGEKGQRSILPVGKLTIGVEYSVVDGELSTIKKGSEE